VDDGGGEEQSDAGLRLDDSAAREREHDWWEFAAAVILSLATLASAWSGYQAARWGSVQAMATRSGSSALMHATRLSDVGSRQIAIDVSVFTSWVEATSRGETELAAVLAERFRADFVPAFEAWLASDQSVPVPDGTPFALAEYQLPVNLEVEAFRIEAAEQAVTADRAGQHSDNYVLIAVLYASVLFFAGIATKMRSVRASHLAVVLGASMFAFATVILLTMPVRLGW
jgi:hypothetical protein